MSRVRVPTPTCAFVHAHAHACVLCAFLCALPRTCSQAPHEIDSCGTVGQSVQHPVSTAAPQAMSEEFIAEIEKEVERRLEEDPLFFDDEARPLRTVL